MKSAGHIVNFYVYFRPVADQKDTPKPLLRPVSGNDPTAG